MICPDNNNSQQCKSQWVEELSICNKTITANKWPKSSLRGLRFQIQSEDLCELHACLGFPCTSEVSDSWMTRNERVNIYGTKVYSACKRWLLWARTVSSNLCEVNCSSVSFKCVITHQELKSHFHIHSFAHAGFHLRYANLTSKWGFSLTETSLGVCGRKCGMDSSHTM